MLSSALCKQLLKFLTLECKPSQETSPLICNTSATSDTVKVSQVPFCFSFKLVMASTGHILLISLTLFVIINYHKSESACISNQNVNGCSVPFRGSFPYARVFKSDCNRHDVCYRCVSTKTLIVLSRELLIRSKN